MEMLGKEIIFWGPTICHALLHMPTDLAVITQGWFCFPLKRYLSTPGHIFVTTRLVILKSGQRLGMLLNILQCTGQRSTTKNCVTCHWVSSSSWRPCDEWGPQCLVLNRPAHQLQIHAYFFMDSIHTILSLPLFLLPSIFPSVTVLSKDPAFSWCTQSRTASVLSFLLPTKC